MVNAIVFVKKNERSTAFCLTTLTFTPSLSHPHTQPFSVTLYVDSIVALRLCLLTRTHMSNISLCKEIVLKIITLPQAGQNLYQKHYPTAKTGPICLIHWF